MTCITSIHLLQERIEELREKLEERVDNNVNNLMLPEVIEINHKIDGLLVQYIRAMTTT